MHLDISRRDFLWQSAAAALASSTATAAQQRVLVVDTHLHCFAGHDVRFPYHERAPYRPEEATPPEHLLRCMADGGVDYAVVVHPEPYQDDHRYLEHCLRVGNGKLKGTALVFADRPESMAQLPDLVRRLGVLAVRVHAYAPERLPPFGRPLRELWARASDLGIAVQLHFEPRYAPRFEPYIREFSGTKVLIDHLGRPFQGTPEEYAVVVGFARYQNTIMKLSSIPMTRQYPHRDVRAILQQLVEAWGPDRLMHAGGYGFQATGASYRAERDRLRALLPQLSREEHDKILGGTAARLFRLD
jgi:predicted TIM-barrel fold metal-dependent hydrolase